MKLYRTGFILFLFAFVTLCGCQTRIRETAASGSISSDQTNKNDTANSSLDPSVSEIPFPDSPPDYAAYNMASNTLSLLWKQKNRYTLRKLLPDGTIHDEMRAWTVPEGYLLDCFVYGSDGSLYAVKKHYDTNGKTRQTLVRCQKNGTIKNAGLKALNQTKKTIFDSYRTKKKRHMNHSITDICFSGTALAITYSNYSVKFYNIREGIALGANTLTGAAGFNAFSDHIFISTGLSVDYPCTLGYYDIRTGEKIRSVPAADILSLTNYRKNLYLLSKDGLYKGSADSGNFTCIWDYRSLSLPDNMRNCRLFAAREDILFLMYPDAQNDKHLYRIQLP